MWTLLLAQALAAPVTFQVNDALVKDRAVEGVTIHGTLAPDGPPEPLGTTDATGHLGVDLAPGSWRIAYTRAGYVPIPPSATDIPEAGTSITAAVTPLLEATADAGHRRTQIVLTWGSEWSDARDVDAHLVCAADGLEVYFGNKDHAPPGHEARLDVDDVSWGGPETITLIDAPAGRYEYFVRNFSGTDSPLGASDVVVRVVIDDAVGGEFRVPLDVADEDWRPFAALVVEPDGLTRIEAFTPEQIAAGVDRSTRWGYGGGWTFGECLGAALCLGAGGVPFLAAFLRRRRR